MPCASCRDRSRGQRSGPRRRRGVARCAAAAAGALMGEESTPNGTCCNVWCIALTHCHLRHVILLSMDHRLAPHYIKGWPVLLAAASLALTSTASAAAAAAAAAAAEDDEGEEQQQQQQRRAFAFLLAASEAALQQEAAATTTATAGPKACASDGVDTSLALPSLACVLEVVVALLLSPLAVAAMDGGEVDAEGEEGDEDAEVVATAAAATAAFRLTPLRLAPLLRAVATLAAAAAAQGGQQAAEVRVLQRLLGEGGSAVPRMLQQEMEAGAGALWEAVEEAALLPLARHLPALFPSSSGQEPNAPAVATSAVLSPSLLVAVSLPAALPRLCPAAQRAEALPRLLSLGLRALTLGIEGHHNNSSSSTPRLDLALVDAGMAVLHAVGVAAAEAGDGDGGQSETAMPLAAVLGEALVVVVTKGLADPAATGTDGCGRRGWEGWLAALPPPGAAAEVEALIDVGLAWVAAASASASDTELGAGDGAFAPPLASPLGTRARMVLLAGARAAVQVRGFEFWLFSFDQND